MRHSFVGLLVVVLTTGALEPSCAPAGEISFQVFSNWYWAYCEGQEALEAGDINRASRHFRGAIELASPLATSDPRPLARTYTQFALVLLLQGHPIEAEPLAQWALKVREDRFGKQSPQVATTLHVLAQLASAQMQYPKAEAFLTRAVAIWEQRLGSDHPQMVIGLNDLATLYSLQRKYPQAERLFQRVVDMPGTALPINHPYRVIGLIGLASIYTARGQLDRAESTDFRLVTLIDRMPAKIYQSIAPSLDVYLTQLRKLGRISEAQTLEASARAARTGQNLARPIPGGPQRPPSGPHLRST